MVMIENNKNYFAPMHTTEHILNQTMVRKFGCERSFSNHIEKKKSKCDYNFTRNITDTEIAELEKSVNKVISSELNVNEKILTFDEAFELINLSKFKKEENEKIRIIEVGDYDICACSGEHVKNTKEIGKFKITTTTFEEGILRLRYKLINE